MAVKTPLVSAATACPAAASGDSISVAGAQYSSRSVTNGEGAAAIVIGAPVYASAADTVKKAKADAKATSKLVGLGLDASIAAGGTGNIITGGILVATTRSGTRSPARPAASRSTPNISSTRRRGQDHLDPADHRRPVPGAGRDRAVDDRARAADRAADLAVGAASTAEPRSSPTASRRSRRYQR
jgi:hypothetical protein